MNTKEALEVLQSTKCACGAAKYAKWAFCRPCFFKLPQEIRNDLYQRLGCGFEETYELAIKTLRELGVKILSDLESNQQKRHGE